MPSGVCDLRGADSYSIVRGAPRGEKTPLGTVHHRPQQKAGEICGLGDVPAYRLWCEPSYGEYLFAALLEIVQELGGGPVGWECLEDAVNHAPEQIEL